MITFFFFAFKNTGPTKIPRLLPKVWRLCASSCVTMSVTHLSLLPLEERPSCRCPSPYSFVSGTWSAVPTLEPCSRWKHLNTLLQIFGDCFLKHACEHRRELTLFFVSRIFTVIHFVVTPVNERHKFNKTNTRIVTREPHTITCLPVTVII